MLQYVIFLLKNTQPTNDSSKVFFLIKILIMFFFPKPVIINIVFDFIIFN